MSATKVGEAIRGQIQQSLEVKQAILDDAELLALIEKVALKCLDVYRQGGKVMLAGNGGSAADAQHLAAELVGRFYLNRPGLPALALTTNSSALTAISNDFDPNLIFARQLEALGQAGDVFIGISTSGNSPNVIEALKSCREKGIASVGLAGAGGGKMKEHCDYCLIVPSQDTPRIQEAHVMIGHIICGIIEDGMFGQQA
jgi:D-sedoheptulose 7-phosphate isomerase